MCETISTYPIKVIYGVQKQVPKVTLSYEVEPLPGWIPSIDITDGLVRFFKDEDMQ